MYIFIYNYICISGNGEIMESLRNRNWLREVDLYDMLGDFVASPTSCLLPASCLSVVWTAISSSGCHLCLSGHNEPQFAPKWKYKISITMILRVIFNIESRIAWSRDL